MDKLVFESLADLGMDYIVVEHPPALTTEEADRYIEGLEGVRTKSMFLTNKKKTAFYLLIMDDQSSWIWTSFVIWWEPTAFGWPRVIA